MEGELCKTIEIDKCGMDLYSASFNVTPLNKIPSNPVFSEDPWSVNIKNKSVISSQLHCDALENNLVKVKVYTADRSNHFVMRKWNNCGTTASTSRLGLLPSPTSQVGRAPVRQSRGLWRNCNLVQVEQSTGRIITTYLPAHLPTNLPTFPPICLPN